METIKKMIQMHPGGTETDVNELAECIAECFNCAQTCIACADACLSEENVQEMTKCIRLNQDCADVCLATGKIMSRLTGISDQIISSQMKACITACQVCGEECRSHQKFEHCQLCADSCDICKEVCQRMTSGMSVSS